MCVFVSLSTSLDLSRTHILPCPLLGPSLLSPTFSPHRRDVTRHLQLLLRREGHIFKTSAEFEVVRTIKEKACFVAENPEKEDARTDRAATRYRLPDGREISVSVCVSVRACVRACV